MNRLLNVLLFFVLLNLQASCSNDTDIDAHINDNINNQALRISIGAEPEGLDPHITTGRPSRVVLWALSENLVSLHSQTLQIQPGVAKSWSISEDGLEYTFHIRENAKWSNGEPLTAEDFVFTWQRIFSAALGNQYVQELFRIKNSKKYYDGEIKDFSQVGVKALDRHTLQIVLDQPDPVFLLQLTSISSAPVHRNTIEKFGKIDDRHSLWTRPGNFVGNGPFTLKRWELNKIIEVERNPNYWDKNNIKLNKIYFYPIEDSSTEERMFRSGQLDIVFSNSFPTEKIAYYQKQHPDQIKIIPSYATYFYLINTQHPTLKDVRIRRALAMTIDRTTIIKNITKSNERPAYALSPPDPYGYTPVVAMSYDVAKAKQLMVDAGYPNGEGFPTLNVIYNTQERHRNIAIAIQQMWKQALNINIELENQEWKVFLDNRQHHNYAISRAGSSSSIANPIDFLSSFVTNSGMNDSGWSNSQYDSLIETASVTMDQSERFALFQRAEEILLEEAPVIPIFYYNDIYLISQSVKNWQFNIVSQPDYKNVYLSIEP